MGVIAAEYTTRWKVRVYELDSNGHVNNAVYLNYVEEIASEHARLMGFGADWTKAAGGTWVVRSHEMTFHQPAGYGDEMELTTRVGEMKGASGLRETIIRRASDGTPIAEVRTRWVWIRLSDGRPTRVPADLREAFKTASG